ncbi:Ig-like domain-containing protein [Pseudomonas sp. NPDC089554]|uniref:Ig-like domain-containing protein n=1 Tax=Pseudomonas sp. NPDC089554 TaxID=3390653 RepID=UPI003D00568F
MAFWKRGKRTPQPAVSTPRPSLIQALEPRMMFDASVAVVADQGAQAVEAAKAATGKDTSAAPPDTSNPKDVAAAHDAAPGTAAAPAATAGREVVFIDSAVSDYQKLIAGLPEGVEVVVLDNSKDGFKQIADYLAGRTDVSSIDIISHGDKGYVYLAGNAIWGNQLASHAADLARIGDSLVAGGDIRFFACNTGAGDSGQAFVNEVARLTGADVAASSDSTGNRASENWALETVAGIVASGTGVQRGDVSNFNTSLATITVTDTDASSTAVNGKVSLAEAIQAANTNLSVDGSAAGSSTGADIIVFDQSLKGATIRWSSASALLVTSEIIINGDVDGDGRGDIIFSGDVNNNGTRDTGEASGLQSNTNGVLTVRNLDFRHFSSNAAGGAIRANGGSITIEDSNFQNNAGSVINSNTTAGSTVVIRNTTIHDNDTSIVGNTGMSSLVRLGGANNHVLENVAIYRNTGTLAGAGTVAGASVIVLSNAGGSVRIINSTIADNTFLNTSTGSVTSAGIGWVNGGAGTVTVQNSIITGNTVNGAALDAATNGGGGGGYTSTTNLIGTSVNFVNAAAGDYRLAASATNAIDQGTASGATTTDLRGFDRPRGGGVDIGAYEVLYSAPPVVDLDTTTGGNNSTVNYTGTPVAIVPNIDLSQTDGDTQVSGATLSLSGQLDGGSETLTLSAAQISLAASYGITISGSGTSVLALSGVATLAQYRAVLASVQYSNANPSHTSGTRSVTVAVNDDMGSTVRTASVVVMPLNVPPVIGNVNGDSANYNQGGGSVLLDTSSNATVTDADSANFAGGNLTVSVGNGVGSEDVLGIRNLGQIAVSGGNVTYGGVSIGTVSGGTGGANLVVTFNANANAAAVQALISSLTYDNSNASQGISQATRSVSITVNDGDGGTSAAATVTVAVRETVPPTATIVVADAALRIGETSQVTITFSEAVTNFSNADLTIANGTLSNVSSSDGGITWTATFTPTNNITDATNLITLNNAGVTDLAGNAGVGTTDSNNYAIDTVRPTASIVVSDTALRAGETSLVTITFSEAVTGFSNADLTLANGTLSAVSSSDGGITWTATFTPTSNITDATNVITLNNAGFTDLAGNAGTGTTDSNNYAIDTARPTAVIVVADSNLSVGETTTVTITFSEAVTGFTNADLTIANGTLSTVSSSDGGITWTATFTPTGNIQDTTNIITLDNTGVTDAAGNAGTGTTTSNNYAIDTARPTATIAMSDSALRIGETSLVTITFSEPVTGFTNADLTVSGGTLSAVSSSDGGITWTATFTPTSSIQSTVNTITLDNTGVADQAGNAGSGTTASNNYVIDTLRPTATIVVADTNLTVGETTTVTITFSEAVSGFTLADLTAPNGTLSNLSSSDGGITWTATLTPATNVQDATNVITLANTGIADLAGNAGSGTTDSNNFAISTRQPTASIVVADTNLSIGETTTVTITFSEQVTGFTLADLTVANGTLSGLSTSDGITWTATLTPTSNVQDATNVIVLDNTGVVGVDSGSAGTGTSTSTNYTIDTIRPTATIVMADTNLGIGETSQVTIIFSEPVTGFTNADLTVSGGNLSTVSSSDGGLTWTATFTPSGASQSTGNVIMLDNTGVTDQAGNAGSGTTNSNSYTVDTIRPTATIVVADPNLTVGETTLVTITFSEAVSGFTLADLNVPNGTLTGLSSADGGITWTATFTPSANVQDATNVITLTNTGVVDQAGNAGTGTTSSNNFTINTQQPVASIVLADTSLRIGETSLVTITFSEPVTGFTLSDLTAANGTLSGLSSADGGLTWTALFTPTGNVQDATNVIVLDNSGVVGVNSGNAGSGTTASINYAVDTQRPTATIVVADPTLSGGESTTVTITFSEAVTGFSLADLSVANGTLTGLSTTDNITWTVTFTPTVGVEDATNLIVMDNTGVSDAAGNSGSGITISNNYAIDTQAPTAQNIVTVDPSPSSASSIRYTVTFSEAVNGVGIEDFLLVATGSAAGTITGLTWIDARTAQVTVSGVSGIGTLGLNLNSSGTGITDTAGNAINGGLTGATYTVDRVTPQVTSVNVPVGVTYNAGDTLTFVVNTDEVVIVDGVPHLTLDIGGRTVLAEYVAGSGTTTLVFQYTVQVGDSDSDGIQVTGLANGSGGLHDAAGNALNPTLNNVGNTSGVIVDAVPPSVVSIVPNLPGASGNQSFTVVFNEDVTGVDLSDFSLVTTGNASGTLLSLVRIDGRTWQVNVGNVTGAGSLALALNASGTGIQDAAGNAIVGGFAGRALGLSSNDGDPEFRATPTPLPTLDSGTQIQQPIAPVPPPFQSPLLPPPLFEVPNLGGGMPTLGSIFIHNGALAPSFLAQVFSNSQPGVGNGSGAGFLGFGGGDASVFGSSSLANIFGKEMPDDGGQYELNGGKPWRQAAEAAAGKGLSGAPTLGQQLQGITQGEHRQARDLAAALEQIKARVPQV